MARRRIGFFPIMVASFATTVAFTMSFDAHAAEPVAVVRAGERAVMCLASEIVCTPHKPG